MHDELLRSLEARGHAAAVVSTTRLAELREAIKRERERGAVHDELWSEYLAPMRFEPPTELPFARSLIVVAYRDPPVCFTFHWRGDALNTVVPPTYLDARAKDDRILAVVAGLLEPAGFSAVPAAVPKKLLAVRSGLARYGRNTVTYVPGMGSYHRLAAFHSDLPCETDVWREALLLDRCGGCRTCPSACPGGALAADGVDLRADRCLTFWNEKTTGVPFPGWVPPASHNAVVGCLLCQAPCPENRAVAEWREDGGTFTEEETGFLLAWHPGGLLPDALAAKLRGCSLDEYLELLPRNLTALIERGAGASHGT